MSDAPDDDFGFIKGEPWPDEKPPTTAEGLWSAMLRYYGVAEPIEVTYATDRPLSPDLPEPTEEQKQSAAETADAQIERWRERWGTVEDGGPSDEFLTDLADPIRLEPRAIPLRDGREL
jgi:hypothetical protein